MCCHEKKLMVTSDWLCSMVTVPKTLFLHAHSFFFFISSYLIMRPVYQGKVELFCLVRPTCYTRASSCRNLKIEVVFRSSERAVRNVSCWRAPPSVFDWTEISYFRSTYQDCKLKNVYTTTVVLYAGQENEMNWQSLNGAKLHSSRGSFCIPEEAGCGERFFSFCSPSIRPFCWILPVASILKFLCW